MLSLPERVTSSDYHGWESRWQKMGPELMFRISGPGYVDSVRKQSEECMLAYLADVCVRIMCACMYQPI